jgi:hypothetical protein
MKRFAKSAQMTVALLMMMIMISSCVQEGKKSGNGAPLSKKEITKILTSSPEKNILTKEQRIAANKGVTEETQEEARKKLNQAIIAGTAEGCTSILDDNFHTMCLNAVNAALATKNMDVTYCQKVTDKTSLEGCVKTIVMQQAEKEDKVALCNDLVETVDQDACKTNYYSQKATTFLDPAFCDQFPNQEAGEKCTRTIGIRKIALSTVDPSYCDTNYPTGEDNAACKEKIKAHVSYEEALKMVESGRCTTITFPEIAGRCQLDLAVMTAKKEGNNSACQALPEAMQGIFTDAGTIEQQSPRKACLGQL